MVFINDMPLSVSDDTTLALFADDAKCLYTIRSVSDCAQLQSDIDTLVEWRHIWKMSFNFKKCSLCTVARKFEPIIFDYKMGRQKMKQVQNQKDLGIMISSNTGFKEHIYSQVSKANKMLGFIRCTLNSRSD